MTRSSDPTPYHLLAGEFRAHWGRLLAGVMAIAVGVALGYAVHLINQAALTEFASALGALMGEADVEIRGPRAGFAETLYPQVATLPQVAAVSPAVEVDAVLAESPVAPGATLKILGLDVFRAATVQPGLVGRAQSGKRLDGFAEDALFLSPAAEAWLKVWPGDTITVQVGLERVRLRVMGSLPLAGEGVRLGVMDIAAAQTRFQRLGVLHRLAVRLRPGSDVAAFRQELAGRLPPGVAASGSEDQSRRAAGLSRAYRVNLEVLALVALFTGAFLVFTSQALAVLRRRGQLALLRVLGVTRAGILRLVLAEGLIQGLFGALLGLVLGYALADGFLARFGGDLGGGYFPDSPPRLSFAAGPALLFFALGVAASLAGSFLPAWEAARAAPARALRAGDEETPLQRLRSPRPGLILLGLGVLFTLPGPVRDLPLFAYLAIACLLAGGLLLMPWLAGRVFGAMSAALSASPSGVGRPLPTLALARLTAAPGHAAIALGGILASFTLMVAMAIMVSSFRVSLEGWLDRVLPADLYLRAAVGGDSGYLSATVQRGIQATPGIARVEFQRATQISLNPERPPITLIARPIDAADPGARLVLVGTPLPAANGGPVRVWASEAMADLHGFRVGELQRLPLGGQKREVLVAGLWRDYARQHGAVLIDAADYRRLSGDARVNDAALWLEPGITPEWAIARLRAAVPDGASLHFASPGEIRTRSLGIFDRSFTVTYLLEAVAMLIGLIGIATAFSAQTLARTGEFAMLRHLGMTRDQIGGLLALEGLLLSGLGCLAGLILGLGIALILIHVINPQSFHWRMDLAIPWRLLATVSAALLASAALTALAAGRRAMSRQALRAVREDW